MASSNAQLGVTLVGHDQLTPILRNVAGSTAEISKHVARLDRVFGSLFGRMKAGIQWHLTYQAIRLVENAISSVIHVIPDLIAKGQAWADVVDTIADVTGMTGKQASELAAVQVELGGDTEVLSKAMVQLSRNMTQHEDVLRKMNVATRDSHGRFLGVYQVMENLRNKAAQTADGWRAFGNVITVLGRGTRGVVDLLNLGAEQYRVLALQAQSSGLVMTDGMRRNAEILQRTQGILNATITGLGTQILGGVAPVLTALVNGISNVIQRNMASIVNFAAQVVGVVGGLIGGLFGFSFDLKDIPALFSEMGGGAGGGGFAGYDRGARKAASGTDLFTRSIGRQIDALDRQLEALDRLGQRQDARDRQRELLHDMATAQAELDDIRGQTIFAAGMSAAEAELARQARAASIIDAQKRLHEARRALAKADRDRATQDRRKELEDQRRHLEKLLANHREAMSAMIANAHIGGIRMGRDLGAGIDKALKSSFGKITPKLMKAVQEGVATGRHFADVIQDLLFGPEQLIGGPSGHGAKARRGGVAGVLEAIQHFLQWAQTGFQTLVDGVASVAKAVSDGFANAVKSIGDLITTIKGLIPRFGDEPRPNSRFFDPTDPSSWLPEERLWMQIHRGVGGGPGGHRAFGGLAGSDALARLIEWSKNPFGTSGLGAPLQQAFEHVIGIDSDAYRQQTDILANLRAIAENTVPTGGTGGGGGTASFATTQQLAAEASARATGDAREATARGSADLGLARDILDEKGARIGAIGRVAGGIVREARDRLAADVTEIGRRVGADADLWAANEKQARRLKGVDIRDDAQDVLLKAIIAWIKAQGGHRAQQMTIKLDDRATRMLLTGRPVTSTTKP